MNQTETFTCPMCEDHVLLVEGKDQTQYGPLDHEPECDVDGVYYPGLPWPEYTVYCPDCGEVSADELLDFLIKA